MSQEKKEKLQKRIAMGVSYRGNVYSGWQRQTHCTDTIQGHLEKALSTIANESIETICAGRTDAGVHGTGQVVHFDTIAERSDYAWKMGTNTNLPKDIRVNWVHYVDNNFHARFSAHNRRYQYIIEDDNVGNAIFHGLITPCRFALDEVKMHEAAQHLLGEHDFTSFRAAHCQANTAIRDINFANVTRNGRFVIVDIKANAFLYHMVRNIVGTLLVIGQGKQSPQLIATLLNAKDRNIAPATAPADGLYLVEVGYDKVYNLPIVDNPLPFI